MRYISGVTNSEVHQRVNHRVYISGLTTGVYISGVSTTVYISGGVNDGVHQQSGTQCGRGYIPPGHPGAPLGGEAEGHTPHPGNTQHAAWSTLVMGVLQHCG